MYNRRQPLCGVVIFYFKNTDMANRPVCYKISHFAGITGNSLQKNIHFSSYLFILRYNVAGLMPSSSAAFFRWPPVALRALMMDKFFFCHAIIIDRICRYGIRIDADIHALGSMTGFSVSSTALFILFCNSLMFPGHS